MHTSSSAVHKERAWKPRLKHAKGRKRAAPAAGSMQAADVALANMGAIENRRSRGVPIDEAYMSSLAGRGRAAEAKAAASPKLHEPLAAAGTSHSRSLLLAGLAAAACGVAVVLSLSGVLGR